MKAAGSGRLTFPADKWNSRFGWFWYNDREIFHDSEDEIDRKVKRFAADGINHLITFSCTHFRWSFRRHWKLLADKLGTISRCCRRHDIYLTEHHSALLAHAVPDEKAEQYLRRLLKVRKSSVESWPGLLDDCASDPLINDVYLSSMRQVQGLDGSYTKTPYQGMILCPNNPHYRKAYFDYLETLYETGIDGIMTDDIHFFGAGCACPHCRRLFKERYGHVMPEPGDDWKRWHGDYRNPSFRAWIDFRYRSIEDYHLAVDKHYEGLGLEILRPDYQSNCLNWNPTSTCLENKPSLDWVFQEACFSTVIRYSWVHYIIEQSHRQMVSRQRDIPHMIMFYPDREDSARFSWGLARYCGALYTGTPEGESIDFSEIELRKFENRHRQVLFGARKLADIAFFDSRRNRELNKDFWHLSGLAFWMQACIIGNLQFELIQASEAERLCKFKVVALIKHSLLSDEEIKLLRRYVHNGGTLMVYQTPGILDYNGAERDMVQLQKLWGLEFPSHAELDDDCVIERRHGKGRYVFVGDKIGKSVNFIERDGREIADTSEYMFAVTVDRWTEQKSSSVYDGKYAKIHDRQDALIGLLNRYTAGREAVKLDNAPDGVLCSLFACDETGEMVVHLLNAADCFDIPEGASISHHDPIPFPDLTRHGVMTISLALSEPASAGVGGFECLFHRLEDLPGVALQSEIYGNLLLIRFPLGLLTDYGIIRVAQ